MARGVAQIGSVGSDPGARTAAAAFDLVRAVRSIEREVVGDDPVAVVMLLALRAHGPLRPCELAELLALPSATIRQRLSRALRQPAGAIGRVENGRYGLTRDGRRAADAVAARLYFGVVGQLRRSAA